MSRILLSMTAVALGLVLTASAEAGPKGGSGGHSSGHSGNSMGRTYNGSSTKNYQTTHGTKLKDGSYSYKGKDHFHWSYSCWDKRYGCNCYWCPSACCYYYWCLPDDCYYPISYCPYGKFSW